MASVTALAIVIERTFARSTLTRALDLHTTWSNIIQIKGDKFLDLFQIPNVERYGRGQTAEDKVNPVYGSFDGNSIPDDLGCVGFDPGASLFLQGGISNKRRGGDIAQKRSGCIGIGGYHELHGGGADEVNAQKTSAIDLGVQGCNDIVVFVAGSEIIQFSLLDAAAIKTFVFEIDGHVGGYDAWDERRDGGRNKRREWGASKRKALDYFG